ncbi:MAG: DUF4249 family protein [Bacteroidales bacterium]|nr:DUF4249 family protein [Bacteroidales bacterium]
MKYLKYLILMSVAVFTSCEYEIDYKCDLPEDRFVVGVFAEEDSVLSFCVCHSAKPGIYDGTRYDEFKKTSIGYKSSFYDAVVKNASVSILCHNNGNEDTAIYNSNQFRYTFAYVPSHGDNITLKIENGEYPLVESNLTFDMEAPQIDSFSCWFRTKDDADQLVVYIEINDQGGENYYMFNPFYLTLYNDRITFDNYPEILYESHTGVYYEANTNSLDDEDSRYNEYMVISNKKFAGQKYTVKLAYNCSYSAKDNHKLIKGAYEISRIDRTSYNYLYSLGNYINSWGLNMNPVSIQNAWDNAYGFIGLKKTVRKPLNIK